MTSPIIPQTSDREANFDTMPQEDLASALYDWLDFQRTSRKVFARRPISSGLKGNEQLIMREAKRLLDDARISIISRIDRGPQGTVVSFIAERVKW